MNSRSLKIGYLMQADAVDMSQISGPQLHVKAVVNGLKRRGHSLRVVAIQKGQILWSDDLVNWLSCQFGVSESRLFHTMESFLRGIQSRLHLPFFRMFDSLRFSEACVSALAGYDILYERYSLLSYGGAFAARRSGIPLVLEVNGDIAEEYAHLGIELSRLQWAIVYQITRWMFQQSAQVVVPGRAIEDHVIKRWNADPSEITIIHNGADVELFSMSRDWGAVRTKYGLDDALVVAYVGGFQPWQGVDTLLKAFQVVCSEILGSRLVLMGDGPERVQMVKKVKELELSEQVLFTGTLAQEDVAQVLSISDVAVAPYERSETNGMKILDYMASGRAIICSAWNGQHAVLRHMETGVLVEPGDSGQLADAMLLLLKESSLRMMLGRNAQQQASRQLTWDHTVQRIEEVCQDLLDQ